MYTQIIVVKNVFFVFPGSIFFIFYSTFIYPERGQALAPVLPPPSAVTVCVPIGLSMIFKNNR